MGASVRALLMTILVVGISLSFMMSAAAVDGDNDGLDDDVDDCPFAWGNSSVVYAGCPDQDGDGNPNFVGTQISDWDDSERALYASDGSSRAVSWAPDSIHLVGGGGSDVILYTSGGTTVSTLYSFTDEYVRSLAFSPNGSYLAAGAYFNDDDNHSQIVVLLMDWSTKSATLLANLSSFHYDDVPSVTWSSNGSYLFTGSGEGELRQFSANDNWSMVRNYSYDPGDTVWSIDASPDNRLIAGLAAGGELKVFWTNNGTKYMEFANHTGSHALGVTFSPDGRWLLTGGFDNRVNIYNVTNASHVAGFTDSSRDVYSISFSPDGAFFVVGGGDDEARIYLSPDNQGNISNYSSIAQFGSFGSGNSRGVRAIVWSPDGDKVAVGQQRGRTTVYILPEGFLRMKGDVTSELMLNRWRSNWPGDGRPLSHGNMTSLQVTQALCNGEDYVANMMHGAPHHIAAPQTNWSVSGLLNCSLTSRELLELPVGRMPASLFVKENGTVRTCLETMGGLSMAQLRWIFSNADRPTLSQTGWAPGMDLGSVLPNDDGDGKREWSDLHPSCPPEDLHVTGRWDNRSVPMMMERLLTCSDCQFSEGFYSGSNERFRFEEESRADIILTVTQYDEVLGFTELMVVNSSNEGLWIIPVADNWTHGAADHIAAGGEVVLPSYENSSNGTWPVQDDYMFVINKEQLADRLNLLDWMLTDSAQDQWDDIGFVRMSLLDRVHSWARIGIDMKHLLPDADQDGVWNGEDECPDTLVGWLADEFGCAEYQKDDDGDGIFNDEDDCDDVAGLSFWPLRGCPDSDGDGWMNSIDTFPEESSQWSDLDGDGFGDNSSGFEADECPSVPGFSTQDRFGCPDADGDGWSDEDGDWTIEDGADEFPLDPKQWIDTDGDGWGDNHSFQLDSDGMRVDVEGDALPDDPTQWRDADGDGFGDNSGGYTPDDCPSTAGLSFRDRMGCSDRDFDGWSDDADAFPDEVTQWSDGDDDGYGDNWNGASPDECIETPYDERMDVNSNGCGPSERDSDIDGIVDSIDLCPFTPIEDAPWVHPNGCAESETDSDGDGVMNPVDGPNGIFKHEPSQWADSDGDGYGDNSSGVDGDACPNYSGTSIWDRAGCLDQDSDGYSDPDNDWLPSQGADAWATEPSQWSDFDGDGYYDNYGDSSWIPDRKPEWPGQYLEGAKYADACPTEASPFADPPGCPPYGSGAGGPNYDGGSSSSGRLPGGLIAIVVVVVLSICGLVGAIVMKQRKPKKTRGRLEQALHVVDTAAGEWADGQRAGEHSSSDPPPSESEGEVGDDGVEWLEWPVDSDRWWFRNEEGHFDEWVE